MIIIFDIFLKENKSLLFIIVALNVFQKVVEAQIKTER